jgi:hypothetical protein
VAAGETGRTRYENGGHFVSRSDSVGEEMGH